MRRLLGFTMVMFCILGFITSPAFAGADTAYFIGIEGIKPASVPPPGLYYKMYNLLYTSDTLTDPNGDEIDVHFDLTWFNNLHRFLWVSPYKLFGGDWGMGIYVPLISVDYEFGPAGFNENQFGLGDIGVEPLILSWHGDRHDAVFGLGFWAPTGKYDAAVASPGKDMWTTMITGGATVYFDQAKTWSGSILARYEIHGEQEDLDFTPGDDFYFEWGIGKNVAKVWDLGLTGYCQWQVSDDDPIADKDSVYAIGPAVRLFIPSWKMFISFYSKYQFNTEDRTEGNGMALTFTKTLF